MASVKIDHLFEDPDVSTDRYTFDVALSLGQRLGQAYYNSLGAAERGILRDTGYDPFYKNDEKSVRKAHNFLRAQFCKGAKI